MLSASSSADDLGSTFYLSIYRTSWTIALNQRKIT
nr:MAG TPA: hypothetical protein [Caudoviricetes sp.]